MARQSNSDKAKAALDDEESLPIQDKPAATLVRSWGKRMAQGQAAVIPVFVGGAWSLQIPRGNKRVLKMALKDKK